MTEAVLIWWYAQQLEDNQGLAEPVRAIFTALSSTEIQAFRHGRIFLCTHVISLFRVDRTWTNIHLLPLFDWGRSPEALAAWTGFLWSPRLYWPLMAALKEPFLQTAAHYGRLDTFGDQYVGLLTFAAIEREEPFTINDFATATSQLPDEGLAHAAQVLSDSLQSAGDRRTDYWQNRVKPYLRAVWPKTHNARTPQVSSQFAELLIATGDAFPHALATLRDWILPNEDTSFALHRLAESGQCARFPDEALDLLDLLVPHHLPWSADTLRENLIQIRNTKPILANDARFVRLETIVRQANLAL